MMFQNARKGIGRIFAGEILGLLGVVMLASAAVLAVFGAFLAIITGGLGAFLLGGGGLILGGLVSIAGYVLTLVGTINAAKDDESFSKALLWVIIGIVISVANLFISQEGILPVLLTMGSYVVNMFSTYFILMGIASVAVQIGNTYMADSAAGRARLIGIMYIITAACSLLRFIPLLGGLFSIAQVVISIVIYILYLSTLGRAKNMF